MVWGGESQEGSSILVKLLSVVVGLPFLGAFLVPSAVYSPPFPPPSLQILKVVIREGQGIAVIIETLKKMPTDEEVWFKAETLEL
jgi:hypothetical protein